MKYFIFKTWSNSFFHQSEVVHWSSSRMNVTLLNSTQSLVWCSFLLWRQAIYLYKITDSSLTASSLFNKMNEQIEILIENFHLQFFNLKIFLVFFPHEKFSQVAKFFYILFDFEMFFKLRDFLDINFSYFSTGKIC